MAGFDVWAKGMQSAERPLTVSCSEEARFSIQKAVELLGFGSDAMRRVPVTDAMQIDVTALREIMAGDRADGCRPACVVGGAGTTTAASVDDLNALAYLCAAERCWFHADGACGAWTAIAPTYRHLVAGTERADSLAFDLHKWMYLQYPIGCILVRDAEAYRRAFSLTTTYLAHGGVGTRPDRRRRARDGRLRLRTLARFSPLNAWMTIREQGVRKYGRRIEQNLDQARHLEALVRAAPELELALPVSLNIVDFR